MISRTDPDRELYEARLRERRDKAALQQAAFEAEQAAQAARVKGLAEGRERGLAEGLAEGRVEGRAETLRKVIPALEKSLGRTTTPPEALQTLSVDELENLWSRLQAALLNHQN